MTPDQDGFFLVVGVPNTWEVTCKQLTNIVRKQIHTYLGKSLLKCLSRKLESTSDHLPLLSN